MSGALILLLLAAFPLMGSPGPATLSLAATGAVYGSKAGLRYLAGIIIGTTGVLLMIATGITGLIVAQPVLVTLLTFAAAGYILYLAVKIATAAPLAERSADARPPSFSGGIVLAIANPKAFAAIAAVYSGHALVPGDLALDAAAKIAALSAVIVIVNLAWLAFGSILSRWLKDAKTARIANVSFAVMLVASVALALLTGSG
jgi:threonine/homoserine/homoserine lactone efflux protein